MQFAPFAFADGIADDSLPAEYDQRFVHPFAMTAYKNMILVSNSGAETMTEEVKEGKGFILAIQGGVVKPFIRPDGHLISPKGMAVYENLLFVADVNKIVVYNLKKIVYPPVEIPFPKEDVTLTDIKLVGYMLLVSVNNTGHIYGIDLRHTPIISQAQPILLSELPGAGMMSVSGTKLYVNSFQSEVNDEGVVYVADLTSQSENPFRPVIKDMTPGQYLGIHVTDDGDAYFSALKTSAQDSPVIYSYKVSGKEKPKALDIEFTPVSPTSILVDGNNLWVTDYVQSKVYRFDIK